MCSSDLKTAIVLASALALAAPLAIPQTADAQVTVQFQNQIGQWVQLEDGTTIFVPQNVPTYYVGGVPYVHIYTPNYGWSWQASPWGRAPVAAYPWRAHPYPYGVRTWHPQWRGNHPYGGHVQNHGAWHGHHHR